MKADSKILVEALRIIYPEEIAKMERDQDFEKLILITMIMEEYYNSFFIMMRNHKRKDSKTGLDEKEMKESYSEARRTYNGMSEQEKSERMEQIAELNPEYLEDVSQSFGKGGRGSRGKAGRMNVDYSSVRKELKRDREEEGDPSRKK